MSVFIPLMFKDGYKKGESMAIDKIVRKKGTVYRVRLFINGKRISRVFERKIDASQFEKNARLDSKLIETSDISFSEAAQEWISNHAQLRKAPRGVATDKQMLRDAILPELGRAKLQQITPERIECIIFKLRKKGLKDNTINRYLELIRTIFNYCIKRRKALYNPMTAVGLLKIQDPPFSFWSLEEANTFLTYVEEKYKSHSSDNLGMLYKFGINTGMRLGEILGLSWHDVDLNNRLIAVHSSFDSYQRKIKRTTKGRKIRHVPINSAIYSDLVEMRVRRKGELIFATISGNPRDRSNLTHDFQRDAVEAGVRKIRFHDLRHTYASHFIMNGGDLYHLKEILGHSDISTTQRY
ncbi:MAG: tyrosine-type recombinase/integrase, partial [Candidatus Bathyarchaeota archaeon]